MSFDFFQSCHVILIKKKTSYNYVISTLSSIILSKINDLAQGFMYLKFYIIFRIYPTHLRYVYHLTETFLAI